MFPADVYDNEFFRQNGFIRKECPSGAFFWTTNPDTVYSGVQDEVKYTFMGKPVFDRNDYTLREIREKAVSFFAKHGHATMESYPVLASLWRDDLLFTSASICDFQPHVIDRELEPQANPIVVPQKCVRLNDLENIGRSGRHLTSFTMLGHHAFNFEGEDEIYWVARTVELCHLFFVGEFGANPDQITYVESVWAGGGNAGPCVEVMYEGIEIATLVFMCFKEDPEGDVDIKGVRYSSMPTRVVDTGYGLERILWAANGTPNIYQAVSPSFLDKLVEITGVETSNAIIDGYFALMSSMDIETPLQYEKAQIDIAEKLGVTVKELVAAVRPSETLYTLCDFTRTMILMLNDHVLPSNKDAGYLVRHLGKRIMTMLKEEEIAISAPDLMGLQFDAMLADFPELEGKKETTIDIMAVELERHKSSMDKARGQLLKEIQQLVKKKSRVFPEKKVFFFYDTLGLPLPYIKETVAEESDLEVEISDDFWEKFFNQSMALAKGDKKEALPSDVATTGRLYYEDPYAQEADGKVLRVHGQWVALDQTIFYPDGGGQPADLGTLSLGGDSFEVDDVRYAAGTIYHHVDRPVPEELVGERLTQKIDWDRRYRLMKAHTTTHVLNATLREVLGFHVRQMGSQNGVDSTRFDIAHYKNVGPDEMAAIEERVNSAIFAGAEVSTKVMKRGDAEAEYGFFIYQGGFVPFDELRIVNVDGIDTEACAGTHLKNIKEVSLFKLLGVSQIQNNVYRLRYSVGDSALKHYQESETILSEIMKVLGSSKDVTAQKVEKLFEDNKDQAKRLGDLEESMLQIQANASKVDGNGAPTTYFFKSTVPKDRAMRHIVRMARTGKEQAYFVIFSDGAVFIRSKDLKSLNFRDSADLFSDYDLANASPDMMVFKGELEAGAAWDIARKVLAG